MSRKISLTNAQVHLVVENAWGTFTHSQDALQDARENAEWHAKEVVRYFPGDQKTSHANLLRIYQRDAWEAWDRMGNAREILVKLGQDVPAVEDVASQPYWPRPEDRK